MGETVITCGATPSASALERSGEGRRRTRRSRGEGEPGREAKQKPRPTPVIVVIGLGNPVCGDDAVGLHVARRVADLLAEQPVPGVRAETTTRGGFELLDLLAGTDRAILVDCVVVAGAEPGRVRELALDQLAGSARLVGAHDISVTNVIELGRLAGAPMPGEVAIIGVEVENVQRLEEALSPAVAAAVEPLAKEVYRRLACPQL